MFLDEFAHGLRHQITDGLPAGNPRADLRRRDIDPAAERRERVGAVIFATAEDDELNQRTEVIDAPPGVELRHVVVADEIMQLGFGIARAHLLHRIDREARPLAMDFLIIHKEARLVLDCCAEHFVTQRRGYRPSVQLVWGKRCGDENHTIEVQEFHRIAGEDQMPVMDRIEGAAVESESLFHDWSDCDFCVGQKVTN